MNPSTLQMDDIDQKFRSLNINKTDLYTLPELHELHRRGLLRQPVPPEQLERKVRETQQASQNYANVHIYDGTLKYVETKSYSSETKKYLFSLLYDILQYQQAKDMLAMIANDQSVIDHSNHVNASDLLADILSHRMSTDVLLILEEQLVDNYLLGQCPQGKTTRLMQVYDIVKSL